MTNEFYLPPEAKAYKAFLDWLAQGKSVWEMFEQDGIPVPETLKRALQDKNQANAKSQVRRSQLRRPERPEVPPGSSDNWVWIESKEAAARTVVLSILNEGKAIPIKELIGRVKQILPKVNEGSIYNMGTQDQRIQRTDEGWELKKGTLAPVLYKNHIWAPPELLQKQDLAAFRRMAVRHLLAISPDGLQIMQVFKQLQGATWLNTPLAKDLIKADLLAMKGKSVRQMAGNSKKWTLIQEEGK